MKYNNIIESIGNTPHIRLKRLFKQNEVWLKLEKQNPGGSIKDRIALAMIETAEKEGKLVPGGVIIEPSSGNTGIGLSLIGTLKAYKVIIVMPENMSVERRRLMKRYGAETVLSPKEKGMPGAIEKAISLLEKIPGAWMPMQFSNQSNARTHELNTAQEIITDFPEGLDYLVSGIGTGGHVSGIGKALKKHFPSLCIIGVLPENSTNALPSTKGQHSIEGIGAGFTPEIFKPEIVDIQMGVSDKEATYYCRQLTIKEGILAGPSTGAVLAATAKVAKKQPPSVRLLTFNYDSGERYLSRDDL